MIFLIITLIYVLLLIIFFTEKDKDLRDLSLFLLKVMGMVMVMATIIFGMQTRKAILIKKEIEEMSIFVDSEFLISSKAELHSLEHNAFSGLLIRKFFTNEENDVE